MNSHYFSEKPTAPMELGVVEATLRGRRLRLYTAPGLFSWKRVDNGTRLLAETMEVPREGNLLDMGCGIGVLGILAALESPGLSVWMTDINPRAVRLARMNVKAHNLINCTVRRGDLYRCLGETRFDSVVSNPPISAGMRRVVYPMVEGAHQRLKEGGLLQMVAQSNKGAKMLANHIDQVFGGHTVSAIKSGYRVLTAVKAG